MTSKVNEGHYYYFSKILYCFKSNLITTLYETLLSKTAKVDSLEITSMFKNQPFLGYTFCLEYN